MSCNLKSIFFIIPLQRYNKKLIYTKKNTPKIKKYLHISEKSSTFAPNFKIPIQNEKVFMWRADRADCHFYGKL